MKHIDRPTPPFSRYLALSAAVTLIALTPCFQTQLFAADNQPAASAPASDKQAKLIQIIQSNAQPQDKAIACKQLAIYGGKDAVPALSALLTNPELSSWARIALEAIPDPSAGYALMSAMPQLNGRLLVGVMNSLAFRRETKAVDAIVGKLKDPDAEVASSAAAALGRIGGETAAKNLEAYLSQAPAAVIPDVADGIVFCAEHFLAEGKKARAVKLYDAVRKAQVPKHKIVEATRGAILAREADGIPLLLEQLGSPDKAFYGIGLRAARELPGRKVTEALAAHVEKVEGNRRVWLVNAIADRSDAGVLPVLVKAAKTGSPEVRVAAVRGMERATGQGAVAGLLEAASGTDATVAAEAKVVLARLSGTGVDTELLARLPKSSGPMRQVLLELAGQRLVASALPLVSKSAEDNDPAVRKAALGALSLIGEERQVEDLVRLIQKTQNADDRAEIEKALFAITGRRGASCQPFLVPLTKSQDGGLRKTALHGLSGIGGVAALAAVRDAVNDADESVQDEAVRMLSTWPNNWPEDDSICEPLLSLVKTGKKKAHQVLGARGFLQYIQGENKLKDADRVARLGNLLPALSSADEKKPVLSLLGSIPNAASIELLCACGGDVAVAEDAFLAILRIVGSREAKDISKEAKDKALRMVIEKTQQDKTKTTASALLEKI